MEPMGRRAEVKFVAQCLEVEIGYPHAKAELGTGRHKVKQSNQIALTECELME